MKVFIFLMAVAACQATSVMYQHPYAYLPSSSVYQAQDGVGNYAFGYHNGRPNVATYHQESGHGGAKVGSYGLTSADGKIRIVDYVADQGGFRANIKSNEEGVADAKGSAGVTISEAKLHNTVPVAPAYYGYPYGHHYNYQAVPGAAYYVV